MSEFTAIKIKGEVVRNETLPFNPIQCGWDYAGACCCEIKFTKGDVLLKANSEFKIMRIYRNDKKGKPKLESVLHLANNQMEFNIKSDGIRTN